MQQLSNEFYHAAIKNQFPDAENILVPVVSGLVARVFKFQTQNGPRVCRFNEQSIVIRNYKLTNALYDYGVTIVKPTQPHVYLGQYFESYEYDPRPTLKEAIKYMSKSEIKDTYKSALCTQAYLASIPAQKFANISGMKFMDVYNQTMPHYVTNGIMQHLYRALYSRFSAGNKICIMHSDLTPENMLVAENRREIARLIDFDSISICNENMAIFGMLRRYPFDDVNDFIEYYQDVSGHNLDRRKIIRMLNLFKKTLAFRNHANRFAFTDIISQH